MTIELKIGQLGTTGASDGDILVYVAANDIVEFKAVASDSALEARLSSNINLVQDNVSSLPNSAANDYATYTSVVSLIDSVQANLTCPFGLARGRHVVRHEVFARRRADCGCLPCR